MASYFPEGGPQLPDCRRLLIHGEYSPSLPVHLCLSSLRRSTDPKASALLIYCGSAHTFTAKLQDFNDEYLSKDSGKGSVASLLNRIQMMYPPTVGHLQGILELLCPMFHGPGTSNFSFEPSPCALVLVDPSNYFMRSELEWTFSSYTALLVEVMASVRFMDSTASDSKISIGLRVLDRGLGRTRLPILSPSDDDDTHPLSSSPPRQGKREMTDEDETSLVYKYFDVVGVIREQSSSDGGQVSRVPDPKRLDLQFLSFSGISSLHPSVSWTEEAGETNVWTGRPSIRVRSPPG